MLLAALVGGLLSVAFVSAHNIITGRTGPEYWLSHIDDIGSYSFHAFKGWKASYQDFPSGHITGVFAIMAVALMCKKYRVITLSLSIAAITGLLFTNSHFLSDCIVGASLGLSIGASSTRFFSAR